MHLRHRSDEVIRIDQELEDAQRGKAKARSQIAGGLADLARWVHIEDSLLALRTAETGRDAHR